MADVSKVGDKPEGPEPSESKRRKKGDSDKFKEMMKVGKVRETDPEEKRKRKSSAEVEEEVKADLSAQEPPKDTASTEPSVFDPELPKTPPRTPEPRQAPPQQTRESQQPPPQQQAPTQPQEPTPREPTKSDKPKETTNVPHTKQKKKAEQVPGKTEDKKVEGGKKSKKVETAQGGQVAFTKTPSDDQKTAKHKEKTEGQTPDVQPPPSPLPSGAWESTKDESKIEETSAQSTPEPLPQPQTPPPAALTPQAATPNIVPTSVFANLPPQLAHLFERMVGVMTVMQDSGITETTLHLDAPQFANSPLYGAQVMITEFSTAPKAFNIQLLGTNQAVDLFQSGQEDLLAAFQQGGYNFTVNRVETGYLPAAPVTKKRQTQRVKRKKGSR